MAQEFGWSCWPENRFDAGDIAVIHDTLSQAFPGVQREHVLVKSETAPLHLMALWVPPDIGQALVDAVVRKLVDAACSAVRRIDPRGVTAGCRVTIDEATIEMYDPGASTVSSRTAGAAFQVAYDSARTRVNLFGVAMKDLLGTGPLVAPKQSWPAPIARIQVTWSASAKDWQVVQVELHGRAGMYVPA